jgi:hypothetical protein
MINDSNRTLYLKRRDWIVSIASALAGCGGGLDIALGPPGTGGTGLFASGPISGFGSVIINNTRFDDSGASVAINGVPATSANLRLGMVAAVQGLRSSDPTLGTASNIDVWSIAKGPVTQSGSNQFTVAGMSIQFDAATVFEGVSSATRMQIGSTVSVWGLLASGDGRAWKATRISISDGASSVSTGFISLSGNANYLNGMLLTGNMVSASTARQMIRVEGVVDPLGQSLAVTRFDILPSEATSMAAGYSCEVEGLVTLLQSNSQFTVGQTLVNMANASIIPTGVQIALGTHVEVEGSWSAGTLIATKIEVGTEQDRRQMTISATVSEFISVSNFVVRGQRCDASGIPLIIKNGTLSDLKTGANIKVTGYISGDVVTITTLEFQ